MSHNLSDSSVSLKVKQKACQSAAFAANMCLMIVITAAVDARFAPEQAAVAPCRDRELLSLLLCQSLAQQAAAAPCRDRELLTLRLPESL